MKKMTMPVRFLGEHGGQWSIVTFDGHETRFEVLYTRKRTEIEQGEILWVHAYLRSESARHAHVDPRMLRYVEERSTEGDSPCPMTPSTLPGPRA